MLLKGAVRKLLLQKCGTKAAEEVQGFVKACRG